jgi:hypothetical protein
MSTFLGNEEPFLLTTAYSSVERSGGRVVVAPLDRCGGDCHLAAYFIWHRENDESIAWAKTYNYQQPKIQAEQLMSIPQ